MLRLLFWLISKCFLISFRPFSLTCWFFWWRYGLVSSIPFWSFSNVLMLWLEKILLLKYFFKYWFFHGLTDGLPWKCSWTLEQDLHSVLVGFLGPWFQVPLNQQVFCFLCFLCFIFFSYWLWKWDISIFSYGCQIIDLSLHFSHVCFMYFEWCLLLVCPTQLLGLDQPLIETQFLSLFLVTFVLDNISYCCSVAALMVVWLTVSWF